MSLRPPKMAGNELEKDGAAWMAGKDTLPQWSLSVKPKQLDTAFQVKDFCSLQMLGYMVLQEREGKEAERSKRRHRRGQWR